MKGGERERDRGETETDRQRDRQRERERKTKRETERVKERNQHYRTDETSKQNHASKGHTSKTKQCYEIEIILVR